MFHRSARRGQVMLMTAVALGGSVLGATTIAGLLMAYQIRQATDLANSSKAIFAADTGIEWALYQFLNPSSTAAAPVMSNNTSYTATCYSATSTPLNCRDENVRLIRSLGQSGSASRAFELNL